VKQEPWMFGGQGVNRTLDTRIFSGRNTLSLADHKAHLSKSGSPGAQKNYPELQIG
jgi:hypothetical protein